MRNDLDRCRVTAAFDLAFKLHADQTRKRSRADNGRPRSERERSAEPGQAAIPYIAHLMSVAALVLENGGTEDEVVAALLHDGPEDQGGDLTLESIRLEFGPAVGAIVEGCSDTLRDPKPPWLRRKQTYLEHLRQAESDSLFLVSMADKVHNIRSILGDYQRLGRRVWDRFNRGRDGTLWYYGKLLEIYRDRSPSRCRSLLFEYQSLHKRLLAEIEEHEGVSTEAWADYDRRDRSHQSS